MFKKVLSTIRNYKALHEDARMGRQLVGYDRYGNKYYQYFDDNGGETKRVCERVNTISD